MVKTRVVFGAFTVGLLLLTGCVAEVWEGYLSPEHGRERSQRLCHPYGECSQGVWVASLDASEDAAPAYEVCVDDVSRRGNGWSKDTVSVGLEINKCMRDKGYRLTQ